MSGNYGSLSDGSKKHRCNTRVIRILLGCYRVSYFATTKGRYRELSGVLKSPDDRFTASFR